MRLLGIPRTGKDWGDAWMDGCWFSFSRSHPTRETFAFYLFGRVNILYTAREEGFYYKILWKKKCVGGEIKGLEKGKTPEMAGRGRQHHAGMGSGRGQRWKRAWSTGE